MSRNHSSKTVYIAAKVHPRTKELLDRSPYNAREAIEYFVQQVSNPRTAKEVELFYAEKAYLEAEEIATNLGSKYDFLKDEFEKNFLEETKVEVTEDYVEMKAAAFAKQVYDSPLYDGTHIGDLLEKRPDSYKSMAFELGVDSQKFKELIIGAFNVLLNDDCVGDGSSEKL